jgi:hypothetical protein
MVHDKESFSWLNGSGQKVSLAPFHLSFSSLLMARNKAEEEIFKLQQVLHH